MNFNNIRAETAIIKLLLRCCSNASYKGQGYCDIVTLNCFRVVNTRVECLLISFIFYFIVKH